MNRLLSYIENELDRNQTYFAQAESNMTAGISFIDHVLKNTSIIQLNEEEQIYVNALKECYSNMEYHLSELKNEINKYKDAYFVFLDSCEGKK